MKLDKTLNFKKVRCVKGYDGCLKVGKEYNVIDVSVEIKIKDDEGEILYWESDHFEPVIDELSKSAENPLQKMELTPEFEAVEPVLADNSVNIQDIDTDILDTNADIKDTHKFEVGDKVYCPLADGQIKTLHLNEYSTSYPLTIVEGSSDEIDIFDERGRLFVKGMQVLYHATQENYEMLSKRYPHIKFEAPPKPLSGDELVKAMLAKGIKNVLCLWVNGDKIVIDGLDYKGALVNINNNIVSGLTPIDWHTGEPLTESVLDE